jgi:mono/diheme cytochrome c family protein
MQAIVSRLILAGLALGLILPAAAQAQDDAAKVFKTNCVLCHSANGSGDSTAGKALKAKDLRSPEVQKQTNAALIEVIGKGKDKMPAFADKIQPDDIKKLVAYVRALGKKK